MRIIIFFAILSLIGGAVWAQAGEPEIEAGTIELRPVADTYVCSYPNGPRDPRRKGNEHGVNAGVTKSLKIKRHENHPLLRFDFSKVPAGATIEKAELTVIMTQPGKRLNHVCAYSLHVDWNEGGSNWDDSGNEYNLKHSGACHLGPKGIDSRWREYDSSDYSHASLGNGGNAVSLDRAVKGKGTAYVIPIAPHVVHAAIEHGNTIALTEETGSWTQKISNGFFHSREAGLKLAPVLKLTWRAGRDTVAPAFKAAVSAEPGPDAGSILVHLPEAGDDGGKGFALGYHILIDGKGVPRVLIPRPRRHYRTALIRNLLPGKNLKVKVIAYDEAGNTVEQVVSTEVRAPFGGRLEGPVGQEAASQPGSGPVGGELTVRLRDGLTLYDPQTGRLADRQQRREEANGLRTIHAVRGDIVGIQVLISPKKGVDQLSNIQVRVGSEEGEGIPGAAIEYFRTHYVPLNDKMVADILAPIPADHKLSFPSQDDISEQKLMSAAVDILIPKNAEPGLYPMGVQVSSDQGQASQDLQIQVHDVVLPDELSFVLEMNTYGHSNKYDDFLAMYRLCHKHRLSYNVLGYGHSRPDSFTAPKTEGSGADMKITDWSAYDSFYGPLFTGEAAKGLPRDGEPATHWYLPFHEGWPVSLEKTDPNRICWEGRVSPNQDKEGYEEWLDRMCSNQKLAGDHFSEEWRAGNAVITKQFIEHAEAKGWTKPELQIFSNHKHYFASGSQSLWVMDEPQYGRDYRALDWLYAFYDEYFKDSELNYSLRADISRPGWGGARFDRGLDLSVGYPDWQERLIIDRLKAFGFTQWWYGGGGNADTDPALYSALFIKKWRQGCSGGMPNWTFLGGSKAWDTTNALRYVTFGKDGKPVPTVRLKACRYGQQILELINMVAALDGFNRWHLADLIGKEFSVKMVTISKGPEDPGYSTYENLDSASLERLRRMLIATLLKHKKD